MQCDWWPIGKLINKLGIATWCSSNVFYKTHSKLSWHCNIMGRWAFEPLLYQEASAVMNGITPLLWKWLSFWRVDALVEGQVWSPSISRLLCSLPFHFPPWDCVTPSSPAGWENYLPGLAILQDHVSNFCPLAMMFSQVLLQQQQPNYGFIHRKQCSRQSPRMTVTCNNLSEP